MSRDTAAMRRNAALLLTLSVVSGCSARSEPGEAGDASARGSRLGPRFTELGRETGLDVVTTSGGVPSRQILEVKGGGLALIDDDRDGDFDVFVPCGATLGEPERGPAWRIFANEGGLRFRDVTRERQLDEHGWGFGVAVGDYDGDGRDDIFVACYGPDVLLRNLAEGYRDVSAEAGVADPRWGTSAAFGDVDGDGDLDLYVTNYLEFDTARPPPPSEYKGVTVFGGPLGLPAQADVLYENLGDGTFRDATAPSGCGRVAPAYGLNAAMIDFDGDRRQDIFVANDSTPNFLFFNTGEGRFENRGLECGIAADGDGGFQASMGIAIADVDGNGLADVFTTNFSSDSNTLHANLGGRFFLDQTGIWGLGRVSWPFVGWASEFCDFDHDGSEDLLVINGHVYPQATMESMDSEYAQVPLLLRRRGERFERVPAEVGGKWLEVKRLGRSAVFGDLDGDGDIDVITTQLNRPLSLLRNDSTRPTESGWLVVELIDDRPGIANRRGLGSRVELVDGDRRSVRWIRGGGPFQSANAPAAHFATATPLAPVTLLATWPDGGQTRHEGIKWGQRVGLRRTAGKAER